MTNNQRRTRSRKAAASSEEANRSQKVAGIAEAASRVLVDATAVLETELRTGLGTATRMSQSFIKDRRIEQEDVKLAAEQVRTNLHDIADAATIAIGSLQKDSAQELLTRLIEDAASMADILADIFVAASEKIMEDRPGADAPPDQGAKKSG